MMNHDLTGGKNGHHPEGQKTGTGEENDATEKGKEKPESGETHHKSKERKEPKIEKIAEELAQVNDKYLRLYSEFDNYRRRTIKEKIEQGKTASAEVISTLLPVLDDFERAISAFQTTAGSSNPLNEGILLIYTKLLNILTQMGLEQMKTIGEEFNTDFHEAITNIPAPSPEQKGKIIDEVVKGYILNGKVIRYAKVVVGS
jgi:molecular chaperone GrpE